MEMVLGIRRFKLSRELTKLIKAMANKDDQNNETGRVGSEGKSELKEIFTFF